MNTWNKELSHNIYVRKSSRHNWFCVAVCANSKTEFIRQMYLIQKMYSIQKDTGNEWQIGYAIEPYTGLYPGNKKPNYVMEKDIPKITGEIYDALINLSENGITPINPQIMGAFVRLELLS